ncbi:MAG TPA: 3-deoxy-7-phosphoheptulonate synthase [Ktedonobacterales bacterium]|jgi:3-deoxy-7-phosphoheptulonate synthase
MVVVVRKDATPAEREAIMRTLLASGRLLPEQSDAPESAQLYLGAETLSEETRRQLSALSGVEQIVETPYRFASRALHPDKTVIRVGDATIGGAQPVVIAGPCAVEGEEQILEAALAAKAAGAQLLRGGAFKPRTSPYSFQGLGLPGLKVLAQAGRETGLPVITEVMEPGMVATVAEYADVLQVGSRNMQNFPLLRAVGQVQRPVLLKRGFAATIEEWLLAAEYILLEGNAQVILCERGVRGFDSNTRNLLDLSAVPLLAQLTHLPVLVDPSHATGRADLVVPMGVAAIAAGADGLLVEMHPHPDAALSDAEQAITPTQLATLIAQANAVRAALS